MLRGFLSGGFWGVIVAAFGLTTASLLAPQPAGNAPPSEPQVAVADVAGGDDVADAPAVQAQADSEAAIVEPIAQTATPAADPDVLIADTTPASPPLIATESSGLVPPTESNTAIAAPAPETPVLPNPQATPPATPLPEADLVLSTATAAPPVPEPVVPAVEDPVVVIPVVPEVVPEVAPVVVPDVVPEVPPEDAPPQVVVEPVQDFEPLPETPAAPPGIEPVPETAPETAPETGPETAPPVVEPEISAVSQPETPPVPEGIADAGAEPAPVVPPPVITDPPATPPPARIVMQGDAANLPQVESGVQVNRPSDETAVVPAVEPIDPGIALTDAPALQRFAAVFDNPDAKPLLSVILIDDGAIAGMAGALAGVPFPVTVAIDPAGPDATARMDGYRAAGIEVLAIAKLPQGAQPTDVEVALESVFATLPQAIGLLDMEEGSLQSSAAVTAQAVARLAADGRGLVMATNGLNPGLRVAETASVPAAEVYRDLDGDGQDARTIRRFLDNAAFQARQQSGIILLARLRPDTISALILWGSEDRAGQVALAPISAVLGQ